MTDNTPPIASLLEQNGVDPASARRMLAGAMGRADDGELYLERTESESLVFDDGRLKASSCDAAEGFGLRVVADEAIGYAQSARISASAIGQAASIAGQAAAGYDGVVALAPARTNAQLYAPINPNLSPGFNEKIAILRWIDDYARARDPKVVQVSASLGSQHKIVEILRADHHWVRDIRPLIALNISVTVERSGRRETGSVGVGGRTALSAWIEPAQLRGQVDEALRLALVALDAGACPAGEMDVVVGPGWNGMLLHEAVGHGLEGDFNSKGLSAFSGRVGEQVAAKGVTIFDDGAIPDRRGSLTIDDEGQPTGRTLLIEDGVLVGYMHDRLSAKRMGAASTGNGRRESYACRPMPRMTNTGMVAGETRQAEMVASVRHGLFCAQLGSGQVDITSGKFVFNCVEAYRIEDGRITAPVKGAILIGDGPSILHRISLIGDDFAFDPGVGTCGKSGQSVPVGVGQPSLKISGLTVGGAEI